LFLQKNFYDKSCVVYSSLLFTIIINFNLNEIIIISHIKLDNKINLTNTDMFIEDLETKETYLFAITKKRKYKLIILNYIKYKVKDEHLQDIILCKFTCKYNTLNYLIGGDSNPIVDDF